VVLGLRRPLTPLLTFSVHLLRPRRPGAQVGALRESTGLLGACLSYLVAFLVLPCLLVFEALIFPVLASLHEQGNFSKTKILQEKRGEIPDFTV
jgi:hypothetical protein